MNKSLETKELFLKLLSAKSITPSDGNLIDFLKYYLQEFKYIEINKNGVKNIFFYKVFGSGTHLCFAGHLDVVPADSGWNSDPFVPLEIDGKIFARGAQDMKSGVCSFVQAVKESKNFNGTLSILLTSDEEGEAKYGTLEVLKHLKNINLLPTFALIAEPTCQDKFGDIIKIGRRGSINGELAINGKGGHAAYPHKAINPINLIAPILPKIANMKLDDGDMNFAESRIVITDIRAGIETTNVTPEILNLMFNVRNSPKTSKEDIKKFIEKEFDGLDYKLKLSQSAKPFLTNRDSKIVELIVKSIKSNLNIIPELQTSGGTSDARFFGEFGVDTVEFGVVNDTIHASNEYTYLEYVIKLERIFLDLIKSF
jgi:succinyl-diaminopimelate desuccinylase